MKRTLFTVCIASLTLAVTAWGAQNNHSFSTKKARRAATVQSSASSNVSHRAMIHPGRVSTSRSLQTARFRPRTYNMTAHTSKAVVHRNALRNSRIHTSQALSTRSASQSIHARKTLAVNHANKVAFNHTTNVNRARNFNVRLGQNFNRQRNGTVVNNWKGQRFSGQKYAAFHNYNRQWHNRGWWNDHCSRVIFISGGWWAWNAGYWCPAWGYDPFYSYYAYDGPIFTGYADLTPDQVIVNVQSHLQHDGYYAGRIDGVLGPMTRAAISNYQADHGLVITSAVDEPTLSTMGLT